jgi:phytoene/squalene synthetase
LVHKKNNNKKQKTNKQTKKQKKTTKKTAKTCYIFRFIPQPQSTNVYAAEICCHRGADNYSRNYHQQYWQSCVQGWSDILLDRPVHKLC